MPCLVPLPSLSTPSSPLPAWMFGIEKKTFNLLSDSNEITIPVVFMGKTLTCPPGFLGGSALVVSFSRYKFKAVRHCLCGIVFKYKTLGQLLQSIFTNSSLLPQKLQTWIQSKLVKKNTQLQLLLNRFYACTLTLSSCHLDVNTLFNCSLKMILQRSQFFTLAWRGRDTSAGRLAKN